MATVMHITVVCEVNDAEAVKQVLRDASEDGVIAEAFEVYTEEKPALGA